MKRVWIGGSLLVLILLLGLWLGEGLEKQVMPLADLMEQAGQAARAEDWEQAERLTQGVQSRWGDLKWITAALTGHQELEQIDSDFVQLSAYAHGDPQAYQAICNTIAQALTALAQNHTTTWKNFF